MNRVDRIWHDDTCAIFGGGPSLTAADVRAAHDAGWRTMAIKDAVTLAPWADVLYGAGGDPARWWAQHGPTLTAYRGLRFTLDPAAAAWATVLRNTGETGLEDDPSGLRTGRHSGYQAINLAVHLGARRIRLLGYDMRLVGGREHWFDRKAYAPMPFDRFLMIFETLVEPLRTRGIEVINCTPDSALHCFPTCALEDVLPVVAR